MSFPEVIAVMPIVSIEMGVTDCFVGSVINFRLVVFILQAAVRINVITFIASVLKFVFHISCVILAFISTVEPIVHMVVVDIPFLVIKLKPA